MSMIRRFQALPSVAKLYALVACTTLIATYLIFSFYQRSVGREIVNGWLQSEAVAIEEGNLLSSISKNQRVLLSSRFISGITLIDSHKNPEHPLIQIGSPFSSSETFSNLPEGKISVERTGFLKQTAVYRFPNSPNLVVIFDFYSEDFQWFFNFACLGVTLLVFALFASIKRIQDSEITKRGALIKITIEDFITRESPSELIAKELPNLLSWWTRKRAEVEEAKRVSFENEKRAALGESARRIVHDIRSPLGALKNAFAGVTGIEPDRKSLMERSITRIWAILDEIKARGGVTPISSLDSDTRKEVATISSMEPTILSHAIEDILKEKRSHRMERQVLFKAIIPFALSDVALRMNAVEFMRSLSNLIDNSVEAGASQVEVEVMTTSDKLIKIEIRDDGNGIPENIIEDLGTRPLALGTTKGWGQGLYYARKSMMAVGGDLTIKSVEQKGTTIALFLPGSPTDKSRYATEVKIPPLTKTLLILDDDPNIHELWRKQLGGPFLNRQEIQIVHLFSVQDFDNWFRRQMPTQIKESFLLSDLELSSETQDGLSIIKKAHFEDRAILITNAYDTKSVQETCFSLSVPLLPKHLIATTPIVIV